MLQSLHIVHKFTLHSSDFTRQEIICQADMEVLAVERSAMKIPNGNDDHHNGYDDKDWDRFVPRKSETKSNFSTLVWWAAVISHWLHVF